MNEHSDRDQSEAAPLASAPSVPDPVRATEAQVAAVKVVVEDMAGYRRCNCDDPWVRRFRAALSGSGEPQTPDDGPVRHAEPLTDDSGTRVAPMGFEAHSGDSVTGVHCPRCTISRQPLATEGDQ